MSNNQFAFSPFPLVLNNILSKTKTTNQIKIFGRRFLVSSNIDLILREFRIRSRKLDKSKRLLFVPDGYEGVEVNTFKYFMKGTYPNPLNIQFLCMLAGIHGGKTEVVQLYPGLSSASKAERRLDMVKRLVGMDNISLTEVGYNNIPNSIIHSRKEGDVFVLSHFEDSIFEDNGDWSEDVLGYVMERVGVPVMIL